MRRLFVLLFWVVGLSVSSAALSCSITSSGTCGGAACDAGYSCKKVSDFKCSCVKDQKDVVADQVGTSDCSSSCTKNCEGQVCTVKCPVGKAAYCICGKPPLCYCK